MDQVSVDKYRQFETRYLFWNKCTNTNRFAAYKILKVGGSGMEVVASVVDAGQYAYIKENLRGMQWITKQDYEALMS
jgi:hypothetical protein